MNPIRLVPLFGGIVLCLIGTAANALDLVTVRQGSAQAELEGRVVTAAQDGGVLLETLDGVLHAIQPDKIVSRRTDNRAFTPYTREQLGQKLLSELPKGFESFQTAHYVICYNTTREYAQWCGSLYEQLYRAFTSYWQHRKFVIAEPQFPLAAVVFAKRREYVDYASNEVGGMASSILGYYSLQTNRVTMCDLTGVEAIARLRNRRGSPQQINLLLAQPEAERTVATIVHEATHQMAFNCGLHRRYSDVPIWFSEGIATFFETPDLSSSKGWRNVGSVNRVQLAQFRDYARRRPPDSLETLVSTDRRFRDPPRIADAYGEAWTLTYFLLKQRSKQYADYLRLLSAKRPLDNDTPKQRLDDFVATFGDLKKLDTDFLRCASSL